MTEIDCRQEDQCKYYWVLWQIVKRHKDYLQFCKKYSQHFDKKLLRLNEERVPLNEAREVKERFCLSVIYNPSKELSGEECYNFGLFRQKVKVVIQLTPERDHDTGELLFSARNLPKNTDYIYVGVNIKGKWKEINEQVRFQVENARKYRKFLPKAFNKAFNKKMIGDKDNEFSEAMEAVKDKYQIEEKLEIKFQDLSKINKNIFKIWDLHRKGKRPIDIIKALWPNEHIEPGLLDKLDHEFKEKRIHGMDAEEAHEATYGKFGIDNDGNDPASGTTRLFLRVAHAKKRVSELFNLFD